MSEDNKKLKLNFDYDKLLVTSALPYANGPIHMGHLVEYIQTDIFVRSQKILGRDVIYCCADDTHGAPISINAEKQGIPPEEFIKKYYEEHQRDFKTFLIDFDQFYSTNSKENKYYSDLIFSRLQKNGDIYEKDLELTYCEHCGRFLPDRYVKGKCPVCGKEDQYGDVCEKCGATYDTVDLDDPYCVICKNKPIRKMSRHFFFKLSKYSDWLEKWLLSNAGISSEVKNQVLSWIRTGDGLKDWCISRDGPYFGFQIPNSDKFYYVWLDAPIGYISSTKKYCDLNGLDIDDYWNVDKASNVKTKIVHFIGKDIIYFHLLFWPAVLKAANLKVPDDIVVHGFLTVNKEKMSKSRGTFLSARELSEKISPEHLRFFYSSNLTRSMTDIDLDLKDFKNRINNDLVSNIANFFYRSTSFLYNNFDGVLVEPDKEILDESISYLNRVFEYFSSYELRKATNELLRLSDFGNSYMQKNEPWKLIKTDVEKTHKVMSTCLNIAKNLAIGLKAILPEFVKNFEDLVGLNLSYKELNNNLEGTIKKPSIYFKKIGDLEMGKKKFVLDLRVAEIESVEKHPDADKLYIEKISFGDEKRQIVSGLVPYYEPSELVGKKIIVVYNLEPAKLRGVVSEGMLLAGESKDGKVGLLFVEDAELGSKVLPEGYESLSTNIDFKQFSKLKLVVKDGKVYFSENGDLYVLKSKDELVKVERISDGIVE